MLPIIYSDQCKNLIFVGFFSEGFYCVEITKVNELFDSIIEKVQCIGCKSVVQRKDFDYDNTVL